MKLPLLFCVTLCSVSFAMKEDELGAPRKKVHTEKEEKEEKEKNNPMDEEWDVELSPSFLFPKELKEEQPPKFNPFANNGFFEMEEENRDSGEEASSGSMEEKFYAYYDEASNFEDNEGLRIRVQLTNNLKPKKPIQNVEQNHHDRTVLRRITGRWAYAQVSEEEAIEESIKCTSIALFSPYTPSKNQDEINQKFLNKFVTQDLKNQGPKQVLTACPYANLKHLSLWSITNLEPLAWLDASNLKELCMKNTHSSPLKWLDKMLCKNLETVGHTGKHDLGRVFFANDPKKRVRLMPGSLEDYPNDRVGYLSSVFGVVKVQNNQNDPGQLRIHVATDSSYVGIRAKKEEAYFQEHPVYKALQKKSGNNINTEKYLFGRKQFIRPIELDYYLGEPNGSSDSEDSNSNSEDNSDSN